MNRTSQTTRYFLSNGLIILMLITGISPASSQTASQGGIFSAAALSGVPVLGAPKAPTRRAPLAPPPINDLSRAYDFRTRLLGDPPCQRFAAESDGVFLNGSLDDEQKAAQLKALENEAQASGCLAP